ncbi:MAG: tripartite tricarboxylate transporter substrate binding protein [Burkholderiales bacterium]|nr:tripartite tricarboxylate transporter substrate binding protein [Burkholderiales bacterium]
MILIIAPSQAVAQQYPARPILIVAPFSAGGDSDLAARNLAAVLPRYLKQNAVVLNKVVASGAIGSEHVKNAAPDGHTLLLARVGSQATLPALKPDLPYKWNDFTFLGILELNPYVCAVHATSPYKTFGSLVDVIRQNPGKFKYSTAGIGTIHEMGPQMLFDAQKLGKEAAIQIPYKGGGEAATALLARQVDFGCSNIGTVLGFVKAGQLRALVTTTPERFKEIPDVPTAKEAGYPMLERIIGWSALYGPPRMDARLIRIWNDTLAKVAKDAQWVNATEKIGSVPYILPSAETAKFVKEQFETYDRLGKSLNIVLN